MSRIVPISTYDPVGKWLAMNHRTRRQVNVHANAMKNRQIAAEEYEEARQRTRTSVEEIERDLIAMSQWVEG